MFMESDIVFVCRPFCELCGGERQHVLLSKSFTDPSILQFLEQYYKGRIPRSILPSTPFEIVRCEQCGFLSQRWILNENGLRVLYSEWIDADVSHAKKTFAGAEVTLGYVREVMTIGAFFRRPAPEIHVLDYGMGWGGWAKTAKTFGYDVSGIELSEERRQHARSLGIPVMDMKTLPQGHFDFINAEQVFEHVSKPREVLSSLSHSLAVGGVIRIAVPNATKELHALQHRDWKAHKGPFQPLEHINCFTHQTLSALGKAVGLTPVTRPLFPLLAGTLTHVPVQLLAPLYLRFFGTTVYFRKLSL